MYSRISPRSTCTVCPSRTTVTTPEATELQALMTQLSATAGSEPLALAEAMVRWACDQGGKDNISVALARRP